MKNLRKSLALILALLMLLASFAACNPSTQPDETTGEATQPNTPDETKPGSSEAKAEYSITVKSAGGLALSGVNVYIYTDDTLEDLVNYTTTDAAGVAKITLKKNDKYVAVLSGMPEGYKTDACYPLSGTATEITLTSAVIDNTDHSGKSYQLGDVMRDFSVVDSDGNTQKLSELLKTKKVVLINFWYTTCSWCVKEFPYMDAVYQQYKDEIEIVALNHSTLSGDSEEGVKNFKDNFYENPSYDTDPDTMGGLSFPMAKDYTNMGPAFNIQGYPTSVLVDRYGVICMIEAGGIVSDAPFVAMFEHFTAENYEQKLFHSLDELMPAEKPNVSMPSSDEIAGVFNRGEITVTYRPETEDENAEMYWPFIIKEKDGEKVIVPANSGKDGSFSIMYADVTMKAGEALAFDYWASCEQGADILYMLVDAKDIYQISGESDKWNTCFTYVAQKDGTYEVAFCYSKDSSDTVGDDTVYLKNLRVVKESEINVPTYIPRYAATDRAADGFGYETYITPVYNEEDGYYHVGDKNGPLLLVDLMKATQFSNLPIYTHAYNGQIEIDGVNYYDAIVQYCNYASNSAIYGLCSVNAELKGLLEKVAQAIGLESDNPNQWLQMCSYYDAYGTNGVHLDDPIRGLAAYSAYTATEGDDNHVYYDRVIMPRGLLYKFVPERSGAYRITSHSDWQVDGWIFNADRTEYYVHEGGERMYYDPVNLSMVVYFEAGKDYYIDIAFYDVYQVGGFTFSVEFLGASYDHFTVCAPGYFTFPDGEIVDDGMSDLAEILSGGIKIAMGDDGYYHELRADGSLGSVIYADFIGLTAVFSHSVEEMIGRGAFNFAVTESDQEILNYMALYGDGTREKLKEIWGEEFEELAEIYKLDEVLEGKTHGRGPDLTADITAYLDKKLPASEDHPELEGCVPVDARLAELLQTLMDKYTFAGVDYSWAKLCYYYQHLGA
ncbi:MAG: redoxin family protein [Clostridia bacterium]|nr:redoxin family protein [Clostridia bacterium]